MIIIANWRARPVYKSKIIAIILIYLTYKFTDHLNNQYYKLIVHPFRHLDYKLNDFLQFAPSQGLLWLQNSGPIHVCRVHKLQQFVVENSRGSWRSITKKPQVEDVNFGHPGPFQEKKRRGLIEESKSVTKVSNLRRFRAFDLCCWMLLLRISQRNNSNKCAMYAIWFLKKRDGMIQ